MPIHHSFAGKRALVTGGASGIGKKIVERLHEDGAKVYVIDRSAENLAALKKELPNVVSKVVDVTNWEETRKAVESFGPLDHLVNNCGVLKSEDFLNITEEGASMHYDVNIKGAIIVTQTVAKAMIAGNIAGTIVNMSSLASKMTVPGLGMYSAAKAALDMLTRTMAIELGPHNIRVMALNPGAALAPLAALLPAVTAELLGPRLIIKRPVETTEIADACMFLLSPLSSVMTGTAMLLEGGATAS